MLSVVGIEKKVGNFAKDGKIYDYDNYVFYLMDDEEYDGLIGQRVSIVKVKSSFVENVPEIGDSIKVYYNQYGKPYGVVIL